MIFHLFTLLFVGLKLTAVIDWSWWLVFAPSILIVGLQLLFLLLAIIIAAAKS
jgi:hypothetical protein